MNRHGERGQMYFTHPNKQSRTGADADGERTETGVMPHNVTVNVIASQKLLQALPRHGRLKSKRTDKWAFSAGLTCIHERWAVVFLPAQWQQLASAALPGEIGGCWKERWKWKLSQRSTRCLSSLQQTPQKWPEKPAGKKVMIKKHD